MKPEEQAATGFWERSNLLGNLEVRTALAERGLTLTLIENSEVFGNATGGVRRGVVYEGLTQMGAAIDMQKAFRIPGGTFNVSAYQIHGRGLSLNALNNNLNTVSSIEALRGTLLFELWYEQQLFDKKLAIRVGQMAADQEFMVSQYATLFINHTFGWSTFPSANLPSGGNAFPLGTPGVRLKVVPRDDTTLLLAVFNGDPAGPGRGFPQTRDASGTAFRLSDGVFAIAEIQHQINGGENATGLPGTYKAGVWYNSQNFADQRRNATGASLADPAGTASIGRNRRGNYSLYAQGDQLVFRKPGTKDQGIGVLPPRDGRPRRPQPRERLRRRRRHIQRRDTRPRQRHTRPGLRLRPHQRHRQQARLRHRPLQRRLLPRPAARISVGTDLPATISPLAPNPALRAIRLQHQRQRAKPAHPNKTRRRRSSPRHPLHSNLLKIQVGREHPASHATP